MNKYYQQGDVIIQKIDIIPPKAKKLNHTILAKGEATGHHHEVFGPAELFSMEDGLFLSLMGESELRHQEHLPIKLPSGAYKINIVREYDHFEEEARRVVD